jgi:hypothetical protein
LRSTDPEVRREAEHRHYSTILHQGSRYEASAYAVPFLLEILADPATPDRHRVVYLLTTLAVGYDESWLPHGFPIAAHRESAAGHRVDTEAERDYRRWILNHEVEDGWFPENAAATVPNLIRLVRGETDDGVAATALVATGLLAQDAEPDLRALLHDALTGLRPLPRWAAAIALARIDGEHTDDSVAVELACWVAESASLSTNDIPYMKGDIGGYAAASLNALGPRPGTTSALITQLSHITGLRAVTIAGALLNQVTLDQPISPGAPFASLTGEQQRAVRAIADARQAWFVDDGDSIFVNFCDVVSAYGLPATYKDSAPTVVPDRLVDLIEPSITLPRARDGPLLLGQLGLWQEARRLALTVEQVTSPLARPVRPATCRTGSTLKHRRVIDSSTPTSGADHLQ